MRFVVPSIDLRAYDPEPAATRLLTRQVCEAHTVVPVTLAAGALIVAMATPEACDTIAELETLTGKKIEPVRSTAEEITSAIGRCYPVVN